MATGVITSDFFLEQVLDSIVEKCEREKSRCFIGIAGIPGAGKSTLSNAILKRYPACKLIQMDGYHIYRKDLDEEGMLCRGASSTFDKAKYREDLKNLKLKGHGSFPSFDHAEKDPREDCISIDSSDRIIVIEGLYIFCKEWMIESYFDYKIYLQCEIKEALRRVAQRHLKSGIEPTLEKATERARRNDMKNAEYVQDYSDLSGDVLIIDTTTK